MSPRSTRPASRPRWPPRPGTGRQGSCTSTTTPSPGGEGGSPAWPAAATSRPSSERTAASPRLCKRQPRGTGDAGGAQGCQIPLRRSWSSTGSLLTGAGWSGLPPAEAPPVGGVGVGGSGVGSSGVGGSGVAGTSAPSRWRRKKANWRSSQPPRHCRWVQAPISSSGLPPARCARCHRSNTPPRWGSCQPPISSRGRRSNAGATGWIRQSPGRAGSRPSHRPPMPPGSWRASRAGPSSKKRPVSRLRRISHQPAPSPRRRQAAAANCRAQARPRLHQWPPPVLAQWRRSSRPAMAGARQSGRGSSKPAGAGSSAAAISSWLSP